MRPLIKYPVTLFILLLVGYTQIFTQLYRGTVASSLKKIQRSENSETLILKTVEPEDIYFQEVEIEEEAEDRFSIKRPSTDATLFTYVPEIEYFHQKNTSYSDISSTFSSYTAFQSPTIHFRVFRI